MSRTNIIAYQQLADQIDRLLDEVNSRFATDDSQPILYMPTDLPHLTLMALRRLARFPVCAPAALSPSLAPRDSGRGAPFYADRQLPASTRHIWRGRTANRATCRYTDP